MLTTRTLDAARVESEGWADALLELDRENMLTVLRRAGLEFPEERRRAGPRDSTTLIILLLDGATLAGYALAVLLFECARALAPHVQDV